MATKYFCDCCQNEIKSGELSGDFRQLKYDLSGKSKQPIVNYFLLCFECCKKIEQKLIELKTKK